MLRKYLSLDRNIFLLSLLFATLAIAVMPYQIYFAAFLILAAAAVKYGERFLIAFVIFSYLTVPSDIGDLIRVLLNILNFLILGYLFLKRYGLEFSDYPEIPKSMLYLLVFTVSTMTMSAFYSASILTGFIEISRTVIFLVLFYWLYSFLSDDKAVFGFINALLLSAIVIALSMFYEFLRTDKFIFMLGSMGYVTLGGYFTNSTAVGGFLAVTLSLTLLYLFIKKKRKYRSLIIFFFLLQLIALFLTNARAAIAAAFVSVMFTLYYMNRKVFRRTAATIIIAAVMLFHIPYFSSIIDNYFRVNRIFENTRYYLWEMAWGMIKDNPILGVGPGMFNHYMYAYLPVRMGSWTEQQIYVLQQIAAAPSHNFFLMRASQEGIFGLISAVGIFIIYFGYGFRLIKLSKHDRGNYYILSVGITGIGLGLLVRSFFEATGIFTNGWITRDLPFWLLLGILFYMKLKITGRTNESRF